MDKIEELLKKLDMLAEKIIERGMEEAFNRMRSKVRDDIEFSHLVINELAATFDDLLNSDHTLKEYVDGNPNLPDTGAVAIHREAKTEPVTKVTFSILNDNAVYDVMLRKDFKGWRLKRSTFETANTGMNNSVEHGDKAVIEVLKTVELEHPMFDSHKTMKEGVHAFQDLVVMGVIDTFSRNTKLN